MSDTGRWDATSGARFWAVLREFVAWEKRKRGDSGETGRATVVRCRVLWDRTRMEG